MTNISIFCITVVDANEIMTGIKQVLGVFFSKEETREFINYLDEN